MSWNNRRLERDVLAGARAACRADPALRALYQRATRTRLLRQEVKGALGRCIVSLVLAGLVWSQLASPRAGPIAAAAALGIWWIFSALLGRSVVLARTTEMPGVVLLLPLSRADLNRHLVERLAWLLLRPTLDGLAALLVILFFFDWSWTGLLVALPLAMVYGASAWSANLWLALCPVPGLVQSLPLWFPFALFVGARATHTTKALITWYLQHVETIAACLPGGWIAGMQLAVLDPARNGFWWWLVLLMPFGVSGLIALRVVARRANIEDALRWQVFDEVNDGDRAAFNEALADYQRAEEEGQREQGMDPFAPAEWNRPPLVEPRAGWVERVVTGWLTHRGRDVLAFCCGASPPPWTRQLWWGAGLTLAGAVLIRMMPSAGWPRPALTISGGASLVFGLIAGTPIASGFGRAFAGVGYAGPTIGALALIPVGLGEVIRLASRAALVRGLVFIPVSALAGAILATGTSFDPSRALWLGAKVTVLVTLAAPWMTVLACATQSNETAGWRLRNLRAVALLVGNSIVLLALGGASVVLRPPSDLLALGLFALASGLGAWRYTWMYSHGWFDLVRIPRPGA